MVVLVSFDGGDRSSKLMGIDFLRWGQVFKMGIDGDRSSKLMGIDGDRSSVFDSMWSSMGTSSMGTGLQSFLRWGQVFKIEEVL
jgi:hypothetical protein